MIGFLKQLQSMWRAAAFSSWGYQGPLELWHRYDKVIPTKTIDGTYACDLLRRRRPDGTFEYKEYIETDQEYADKQW